MTRLRDNEATGRLEMIEAGQVVFATYRREGGRLVILHVESPPSLRGSGAASRFMDALAQDARDAGERIVPVCGYAATWLRRHPTYRDLLA